MRKTLAGTSYFVCATPRSGSTLFCEALSETGVAGRPAEYYEALRGTDVPRQPQEYFDTMDPELESLLPPVTREPVPELARARDYLEYLAWTRRAGTTPNGVFGAKLMWGYLGEFASRLRETGRFGRGADLDVLEAAFPGARYVRVVRQGKVEQAVSLWTAIQTQSWRHDDDGGGRPQIEPVYHRGAIDHLVRYLTEHEEQWTALFGRLGIEPLTILYEDLLATWDASLRRTLAFIGVPDAATRPLPGPPLQRQAGGRSREWVERYLAERISADLAAET